MSFFRTTPIRIYDRNEELKIILDPNGEIPYFNAWYREQLNGEITLEFDVPNNYEKVKYIENDGRAVIRNQDGELVEFIIRIPDDTHIQAGSVKTVFCEGGQYELIDEWIGGYNADGVTLKTALEAVLSHTRWDVGEIDDFGTRNIEIEPTTVKNAVYRLLELFGGEQRLRVKEKGNKIVQRIIDVYKQRGTSTHKRFEYKKDINSIRRTIDSTGIKTALYGYGSSGSNDSPRLTFASVEWRVENGDPTNKPLGQTYVGDPIARQKWGYNKGARHRFGEYSGNERDPAELLMNTWKALQSTNDVIRTYELNVALLDKIAGQAHEKVRLGDRVTVIDNEVVPSIRFTASVIEYRQHLNDDSQNEIVVGNFRHSLNTNIKTLNAEKILVSKSGMWDEKETPEGAREKAREEATKIIGDVATRIDEAERKVIEAETDIADTLSRLETAEGNLDHFNTTLNNTTEKIEQASNDVQGALEEINSLSLRVDTMNDDFSSEMSDLLTAIDHAQNRISTAESRLNDADRHIESMMNDVNDTRTIIDSVTDIDTAGQHVLSGTLVTNKIMADNAILTGTITSSFAVLKNFISDDMTVRNAVIDTATIQGILSADNATFNRGTFDHVNVKNATVSDAVITGLIGAKDAVFNNATMQNSIVTGTLDARNGSFLSGTFKEATIVDATIQNATITGTLNGVNGTFKGTLDGASGVFNGSLTTYQETSSERRFTIVNNGNIELTTLTLPDHRGSTFFMKNQFLYTSFEFSGVNGGNSYIHLGENLIDIGTSSSWDASTDPRVRIHGLRSMRDSVFDGKINASDDITSDGMIIANSDLRGARLRTSFLHSRIWYDEYTNNILAISYSSGNFYLRAGNGIMYLGNDNTTEVRMATLFRTNQVESGYCGVGGQNAHSSNNWNVAGVGVNFRIKKSYTPSSINLSSLASNTTGYVTQITSDGFWLYVNGAGAIGGYYYWRGTYSG